MMRRIMVDTSIWIEYFRGNFCDTNLIEQGLSLGYVYITGPIVAELLQGVKTSGEHKALSRCISAVPFVECGYQDWVKAGNISFNLRKKGVTVPLTDIIIAVAAIKIEAAVYTRDRHFKEIPGVKLFPSS
ncbi:MAG: PIN domain nuclease [Firmicutes bacterium HGW-Firmicutes-14]|nr:MAG: PIN domain nuclease [Firmicutes bacterium HGW-Firmicutes-14]